MIVNIFIHLTFFYFNIETEALEVRSIVNDNNIAKTESAIRNVTNKLFLAFKLKDSKKNPTIRQYSLIHNFFTSITLQDVDTLRRVETLSRVDENDIHNETSSLVNVLMELLSEDSNNNYLEELPRDYIQEHINTFIANLEYLKNSNGVNDNTNLDINTQILEILQSADILNVTEKGVTENYSDEDYSILSDNEFWVPEQSGRRIFQGDKTKIKYFPFMASIQVFNNFQCGGCIIKSDIVITAASCLQLAWNNRFFRENPAFLSVRIGSNFYIGGGEVIPVLEVYFYPRYDPKTLKNNICLLRLMRRIKFKRKNKHVKKIDFDRVPSRLPLTTDGITIVGWGAKGISNKIRDPWYNQLSFSVLDIYPLRECQDVYSRQYITTNNFCAGFFSKGGGACHGDVGGPGIVNGILAGVVSFGSPRCGTPDVPTVFTKLGYYAEWIENIMDQNVPHAMARTTLRPQPLPTTKTHMFETPTTFKIQPLAGKLKPIPINQVERDKLRVLEDEDLFKEFLNTMFESKEVKDYAQLFDANETEKFVSKEVDRQRKEKVEEQSQNEEQVEFVSQLNEKTTQPYKKITVMDNTLVFDDRDTDSINDDDDDGENVIKTALLNTRNDENGDNIDRNDGNGDNIDRNDGNGDNIDRHDGNGDNIDRNDGNGDNIDRHDGNGDYIDRNDGNGDNIDQNDGNGDNIHPNDGNGHNIDQNVKELFDKIEVSSTNEKNEPDNYAARDIMMNKKPINIDNPILTLLYLSDTEKNNVLENVTDDEKNNVLENVTDDSYDDEGMSIPVDGFEDLTFRTNETQKKAVINFLPKDEIFELLTEAINDVAKNKGV